MRLYQKVLAILAIVIPFCQNTHASTCDSISLALMEQTWREFRAIHPFSFQTVALKHKGDTCVFVMSEPNNWVKEIDLRQLFDKYEGQLTKKYQPYGIDGRLTDAVGCVKLDSLQFPQFEKEVFNLLYCTDYKPFYTDLDHPSEHVFFSGVPLNYSYTWERLKSTRFLAQFPNDSICEMSIPRLCNFGMTKTNDIFYSKHRGYIVWVIADNIDYQNDPTFLVNARKFALDSDLICGTFRSINKIAIIGREREVPVNILPPLRSETILSLASTKESISLVFNKDSVNVINDTLNATPIKMSSMLNDTELGNLMVMTDVFLKSWSENGKVKEYIINHPQPNSYPFLYGVAHALGDSTRLIWNFENVEAGYSGFYPVIQTGSLPPTYWSVNDSLMMMQNAMNNIAYSYFARLNCPDLVRVVMYTTLYHIFYGFGTKHPAKKDNSWVQTPSLTISNAPWGSGGYQGGSLAKGLVRGIANPSKISGLTASRLRAITAAQNQISRTLQQATIDYRLISSKDINKTLFHTQKILKHVSAINIERVPAADLMKIETTLYQAHETLTRLLELSSEPKTLPKIKETLSLLQNYYKELGIDINSLRIGSVYRHTIGIIHSVIPNGEKRGFDSKHVNPASHIHVLSETEVKNKLENKRDSMIFEMRQQIIKNHIPLKAFKAEIEDTDFGFIIIIDDDYQRHEYDA